MRQDKNKALKLRLEGKSYNEINKILGIPKATLSGWFTRLELSDKANNRISKRVSEKSLKGLIERNKSQTHLAEQRARATRETAKREITKLSKRELFLLGVSIYWTEGYKKPIVQNGKIKTFHSVSITNSDPNLIKMFTKFLIDICKVPEEKITANLRIYKHQNENYLLEFWSKTTNIPYSRIKKFYYGVSESNLDKKPFNTLPYGTIQIRVNNTELYHKIMGWIDGLSQQ